MVGETAKADEAHVKARRKQQESTISREAFTGTSSRLETLFARKSVRTVSPEGRIDADRVPLRWYHERQRELKLISSISGI
jgi:hypothetical protein